MAQRVRAVRFSKLSLERSSSLVQGPERFSRQKLLARGRFLILGGVDVDGNDSVADYAETYNGASPLPLRAFFGRWGGSSSLSRVVGVECSFEVRGCAADDSYLWIDVLLRQSTHYLGLMSCLHHSDRTILYAKKRCRTLNVELCSLGGIAYPCPSVRHTALKVLDSLYGDKLEKHGKVSTSRFVSSGSNKVQRSTFCAKTAQNVGV